MKEFPIVYYIIIALMFIVPSCWRFTYEPDTRRYEKGQSFKTKVMVNPFNNPDKYLKGE